jgi:hypothetical protein
MKQKDLALFVIVGVVSAVLSVLLSNFLLTPSKNKVQKAEVVEKMSTKFDPPVSSDKYFNKEAINPTIRIEIGDNSNPEPVNGSTN